MHREHIRATPSWRKGPSRYDCMFLNSRPELDGMRGLDVVRVLFFFSFSFRDVHYPCVFVQWFTCIDKDPDEETGMWIIQPELEDNKPVESVIHLDCVV